MGCPSEDDLLALVEGRLKPVPATLERHLDQCAECRDVVVAAASIDSADDATEGLDERYAVRGEVGRGGQSRVLRVYDRELGREIALKQFVTRAGGHAGDGPSPADRCLREVRVTGALSHPAILPIHDMGVRRSGEPYYTMPLVEGPTLAEVVAKTPTVSARLRLLPHVVQVCQAIGYAHKHGFVHRDLKPDNIMVGTFGQTLLVDWGLARVPEGDDPLGVDGEDDEVGVTIDGSVLGTPTFMSPEQAAADSEEVGPRSDIWSLGAVLYFVLCGRAPFGSGNVAVTLRLVRQGKPRPVVAPDGDVPPALAAVVRRAMAVHPGERYATATELAEELIAYQSDGRVSSYSYPLRERALRFAKQYRALLLSLGAVFASLVAIAVNFGLSYQTEARARAETDEALEQAQLARSDAELASEQRRRQAIAASYQLAVAHIDAAERERASRRMLLSRLFAASSLRNNPSFPGSPLYEREEGDRLAVGGDVIARALGQLALARLDPVQGVAEAFPLPTRKGLTATARGGQFVVLAYGTRDAQVVSIETGAEVASLSGHDAEILDVALSPAGRYAVTQDASGVVIRWRLPDGEQDGQWRGAAVPVTAVAVSDRGLVAFDGENGDVSIAGRSTTSIQHTGEASRLVFSEDGSWLAIGAASGRVANLIVVDADSRRETARVEISDPDVTDIVFSADTHTIFVSAGRHVTFVDRRTASATATLDTLASRTTIALSRDGRYLAAGTNDSVQIYSLASQARVAELDSQIGMVRDVWLSANRLLAWGDGGAQAWEMRADAAPTIGVPGGIRWQCDLDAPVFYGQVLGKPELQAVDWERGTTTTLRLPGSADVSQVVTIAPYRATLHHDGTVHVWKQASGRWEAVRTLAFDSPVPIGLAGSPATRRLAVARSDGSIELWGLDDEGVQRVLRGHRDSRRMFAAFSDDGEHLVSATFGGEIFAWDLRDGGQSPEKLAEREENPRAVAFGATTDAVFAAGTFGVKAWSRAGASARVLSTRHHLGVHFADGLLAMRSEDGTLTVWDTRARRAVFVARPGDATLAAVAAVEPGGAALRVIGRREAFRLPLSEHEHEDAEAILADAERAAGRKTDAVLARPPGPAPRASD